MFLDLDGSIKQEYNFKAKSMHNDGELLQHSSYGEAHAIFGKGYLEELSYHKIHLKIIC